MINDDETWMSVALEEAALAAAQGEVPVGAVVVADGKLVARGRNAPIRLSDPSAHAEILALRAAGQVLQNYRLPGAELFVTVEPCAMCVGAILQARIQRVVFGCDDPKGGALGSVVDLSNHSSLNHRINVTRGIQADAARELLQSFFASRRSAKRTPA